MHKIIIQLGIFLFMLTLACPAISQETLRYNGSSVMLRAIMYKVAGELNKQEGIHIDLKGKDTIFGINKLLTGEADITGGGRALTPEEKAQGLVQKKLFLDARAFVVNSRIPVELLSTTQISDILMGKIKNWNTLAPIDSKMHIIAPNSTSAHYLNQQKITGYKKLPAGTIYCDRVPDVPRKIFENPYNAVGFTSYSNAKNVEGVRILTISVNGEPVPITKDNISSGKYPYVQSMYFYTVGEPKGNVQKFIKFLESEQGREIIADAGFFTLN